MKLNAGLVAFLIAFAVTFAIAGVSYALAVPFDPGFGDRAAR